MASAGTQKTPSAGSLALAGATGLLAARTADVGANREKQRRRRLWMLAIVLAIPTAFLTYRIADGRPFNVFALPSIDPLVVMPVLFFALLIVVMLGMTVGQGRSPHLVYRPEQIDVRLDDVRGIDPIKEDVVRSLNLFLAHKTFSADMGGTPRRGLLFEGAPGTGKTYLAKAMAAEAGVPFLFVSATSFQSMFYGATAKKIRSYFKALRKAARQQGGAIGFIEEIDAIGMARGAMGASAAPAGLVPMSASHDCGGMCGLAMAPQLSPQMSYATTTSSFTSEGTGGVVNELLVQMQSFDEPTGTDKVKAKIADALNLFLPEQRQIQRPERVPANILLIAATNRADGLDPALMRPGRFDRRLTFEMPAKAARRDLIDHMLAGKAHDAELDGDERRDALAAVTQGYSPVMIEHLMDEALVSALRRGATAMSWADLESARLVETVGLGQPVEYTEHEKRLIATHEAGHATIAHLTSPERRLEILSIIKRASALGMLAHGDRDDVYTRSSTELTNMIKIAMGGQVAEEIFFGDVSTGPASDLAYATTVACEMVGSSGMTGTLISMRAVQSGGFGGPNLAGQVLADNDGRATVERLLSEQKATVTALMTENRHIVEALRDALLERSELIGHEITDVIEAANGARVIDLRDGAAPQVLAAGVPDTAEDVLG